MNAQKIGSIEAIALVCIVMANQILLNLPENIIHSTGSASWINVIFIAIIAITFTVALCKLFEKFTGKDILDISEYVGGKWLKFIVGASYIGLFSLISATLLKYFSESLKIIYFQNTPILIIISLFIFGVIIANRLGLKAICNINLVIVPIVLVSMLIIFVSTFKLFVPQRLFPILGYGIDSTFFSGASNLFAFGGIAFLYFVMPLLKNYKNFKKISSISIIISSIYLFLSVISLLMVFSFIDDTNQTLAIYSLSRIVEFGRFFQRTDALFILLWILLVLSYLSTVVFMCLYIFKKITHISNPNIMVYSFSILMFALSLISSNIATAKFIQVNIYRYFELILVFGISFIILIIANIKITMKNKKDVLLS